ncbi:MAG: hypothetical protein SchgKO_08580 [Schleiferiaceae bacterium]
MFSCNNAQETDASSATEPSKTEETVKVAVVADSEVDLEIGGMTCEMGCKGAIEKALSKAPGIEVASVDFPTETAVVKYDSKVTSEEEIIEVIQTVANGAYTAKIAEAGSVEEETTDESIETEETEVTEETAVTES